MPRRLPITVGVQRKQKSSRLHEEVVRNLQDIADLEDKSFSWVVAEIVYKFFGLEIDDDFVEIRWTGREKKTRQRSHRSNRGNERRVATPNILRFEERRNGKRSA